MSRLKPVFFLPVLLLSSFGFIANPLPPAKWVISSAYSLKVAGSTNVNKFACVITDYSMSDTLICYRNKTGAPLKLSGRLQLEVQDFDCQNAIMTKDLRKTLKAKDFPVLTIRFLSLNRYPDLKKKSDEIKGIVLIGLAGVTKQYEVDYKFIPGDAGSLNLKGSRQINFSDFNIVPPRKIGGMIRTNNELNVEFNLKMRVLD
jgi:hypothetical protein